MDQGWIICGNTLIRSVLHMDPDTLTDDMWCLQVRMAEWMENERARRIARLIAGV